MTLFHTVAAEEMARACRKAHELYGFDVEPTVSWDLRGLTAGQALYERMHVRLNSKIAAAEGEAFRQTVGHEVAHLVTYWRWDKAGRRRKLRHHGLEWQSVMRALGYEARRCHNYASAERVRKVKRYTYVCRCGIPHTLSSRKHSVMQMADRHLSVGGFFCACCKTRLQFNP